MRSLVLTMAMVLTLGCSRNDAPTPALPVIPALPPAPAPIETQQALISATQWCSQLVMSDRTIYNRYNFSYRPSDSTADQSTLTQDQIVDLSSGDLEVYTGESLTSWTLKEEGSTGASVEKGYRVELVSDLEKVSSMMLDEGIKSIDDKPISSALNIYPEGSTDINKVTRAFPCASLVDVSQTTPRSFAELQIRLGQEAIDSQSFLSEAREFWTAMNLKMPIQEIGAAPEVISSTAWCAWFANKHRQGTVDRYELQVTVKVFNANGSTSSQHYVDIFTGADERAADALYTKQAMQAEKSTWKIEGEHPRVIVANADSEPPTAIKLIQDKDGRKALFSVNSESPDEPASVSPHTIYYDCRDPVAHTFQTDWSKWVPKIVELQTKGLN